MLERLTLARCVGEDQIDVKIHELAALVNVDLDEGVLRHDWFHVNDPLAHSQGNYRLNVQRV